MIGAQRNCINEYVAAMIPTYRPAMAVLPPANSLINSGSTGTTMPMPTMSINKVIRMNASADRGLSSEGVTIAPSKKRRLSEQVHGPQGSRVFWTRLEKTREIPRRILPSRQVHRIVGQAFPSAGKSGSPARLRRFRQVRGTESGER